MNDLALPQSVNPTVNEDSFTGGRRAGNAGAVFRPTAMDGGRFGLLPSRGITPSLEGRSAGNAGADFRPGRRAFLKAGAVVGGGLLIGFHLPLLSRAGEAQAAAQEFVPHAWMRIAAD